VKEYFDIKQNLEKGNFQPVYFFDGEEPFYIDHLIRLAEEKILQPEEKDFNLITLYGRDTSWSDVVNAARRFPMFAEKTVVILREAAQLKGIDALGSYVAQPSASTVLVIDYRLKELDKRTNFSKIIKKHAVYFSSKKIREDELPVWISDYARQQGYVIGEREALMLAVYLGNDLQKITNELEKIRINEPELQTLSPALIEKYIGISKEYQVIDLPLAVFSGDVKKQARMLQYFLANPKSAAMPAVIGVFYNFINKLLLAHYSPANFQEDRKLGIWSHHRKLAGQISLSYVHRCLALLEEYSHKTVGVDSVQSASSLLKEMTGKLTMLLFPNR